jgi:hypothetical protein
LKAQEPIKQFLECLHAALAGHQCHIATPWGTEPPRREGCWGWREETVRLKKQNAPILLVYRSTNRARTP